jgi:AraC-like DNA-binding protein
MIAVQYEPPGQRLERLISSFYRLDFEGEHFSELERADRAQFRFQLRGTGEYHFCGGTTAPSYPVAIIGPTSAPVRAIGSGSQSIFGWGLLPAGWGALMGREAGRFGDAAIDARQIFGESVMSVHQQLAEADGFQEQLEIGRRFARDIFRDKKAAPFEFTTIVDDWLNDHIDPDVDQLATKTGLSSRQLERVTRLYYGMPPKKLARKYRALRAAQVLAAGDSLDDTGMALAFYDQSHLIREVKAFTGLTPGQLKSGESELTQLTMDGRRSLGGKVSNLISDS